MADNLYLFFFNINCKRILREKLEMWTHRAATQKIAANLVACYEDARPRFGMALQRMVGSYACSYVTYSDYHRPAHRPHFAFQWHDALA